MKICHLMISIFLTFFVFFNCTQAIVEKEEIKFTVTYNGMSQTSGSVPVDSKKYVKNGTVTVAGNTGYILKINEGGTSYKFNCWNTDADMNGTDYNPGDNFKITSNVILYAKWTPYSLRDEGPAGGFIFYDKGSYADGWRYMEAAPSSTEISSVNWGPYGSVTGATATAIGTGQANTATIGSGGIAYSCGQLSVTYNLNVYNDWFMPSRDELYLMDINLEDFGIGGFIHSGYYWSSTESSGEYACFQYFGSASQGAMYKDLNGNVRACRVF